jgi:hypothetical protein
MKSQLLAMTELKEETELKLTISELLIATLKGALRDTPSNNPSGLNLSPDSESLIAVPFPSTISSTNHTLCEKESNPPGSLDRKPSILHGPQVAVLTKDLERMTQLRDMAETRAGKYTFIYMYQYMYICIYVYIYIYIYIKIYKYTNTNVHKYSGNSFSWKW